MVRQCVLLVRRTATLCSRFYVPPLDLSPDLRPGVPAAHYGSGGPDRAHRLRPGSRGLDHRPGGGGHSGRGHLPLRRGRGRLLSSRWSGTVLFFPSGGGCGRRPPPCIAEQVSREIRSRPPVLTGWGRRRQRDGWKRTVRPVEGGFMHDLARDCSPSRAASPATACAPDAGDPGRDLPGLMIHEVPSGTPALDWTVPDEWNIRARLPRGPGRPSHLDLADSNLHVVGYSVPVDAGTDPRRSCSPTCTAIAELPDAIPYVTSYYNPHVGLLPDRAACGSRWSRASTAPSSTARWNPAA